MLPMKTHLHCPAAALLAALALGLLAAASLPAADGIANLRFSQRAGTTLVDIRYDLATTATNSWLVVVTVSTNGGLAYNLPATHFTGDVGWDVTAGTNKWIVWDALRDWPDRFSTNVFIHLNVLDASGMALIPAGPFVMGDSLDGDSAALPRHTNQVSAFYMDKYDVTKAFWDSVYSWAITNGYSFDGVGSGKAPDHPVQEVSWYDAVKWCNARSEHQGRSPAYYTSAEQTAVYRSGQINVQNDWVKWSSGYRLPTEAEWEKAARGGLNGQRFPWGNTISWSQANYQSYPSGYAYDVNPTSGYHPTFNDGAGPYTSPVGYFAANGYGLYDMAGNVWQWCWDWYGSYSSGSQTDPRGPASGSNRVFRGGSWRYYAYNCRAAYRDYDYPTYRFNFSYGFRSVLPPGQ